MSVARYPILSKLSALHLTIRQRLIALIVLVAAPLLLMMLVLLVTLGRIQSAAMERTLEFNVSSVSAAVDAEIEKFLLVAELLTHSDALHRLDFATFAKEASFATSALPNSWIAVCDESGHVLFSTLAPNESGSPLRAEAGIEAQRKAFAAGRAIVSDVFTGRVLERPVASVEQPVVLEDGARLEIAIGIDLSRMFELISSRKLPDGWLAGIVDRNHRFIARSVWNDSHVGALAAMSLRDPSNEPPARQAADSVSLEGVAYREISERSELTGWTVRIAVEKRLLDSPVYRVLIIAVLGGLAVTVAVGLMAVWLARRISRPIREMEDAALSVARGEEVSLLPSHLPEIESVRRAFDHAAAIATERDRMFKQLSERESQLQLVLNELSHRSKNLLTVVRSLAQQVASRSTSYDGFEAAFFSRLEAITRAHDLLFKNDWAGATVDAVLVASLKVFENQVSLDGPAGILLLPKSVQDLSMATHELITNAIKYGALSGQEGRVHVLWHAEPNGGVVITWRESGGPRVQLPTHQGFGTVLLNMLGRIEYRPEGVMWTASLQRARSADDDGNIAEVKAA